VIALSYAAIYYKTLEMMPVLQVDYQYVRHWMWAHQVFSEYFGMDGREEPPASW